MKALSNAQKSCRTKGVWMMKNDLNTQTASTDWDALTFAEKKLFLYLKQKAMLDTFLAKGAITKAEHDKSLHNLTVKMGQEVD